MDPLIIPQSVPSAKFTPVLLMNLKAAPALNVASSAGRAVNHCPVVAGTVTTVPNELGLEFDATVEHGFDDITVYDDSYARLDCRLYAKTANGARVLLTYDGVLQLSENVGGVLAGKGEDSTFEQSYVTSSPRIEIDASAEEKHKWVRQENFFGKGRLLRKDGTMYVQYFVYVVR